MHSETILILSGILALGLACQWLAWKSKLPSILFLLVVGIVLGPILGWLKPQQLLGELFFPVVSLAVAVILFEGSLTLKFSQVRGYGPVVRNLVTLGTVITWVTAAVSAHWVLDMQWSLAILFGAIVVVSGPTVVIPLLRAIRPHQSVSNVLRWEGILIDPMGAILAVLVFDIIIAIESSQSIGHVAIVIFVMILTGVGLGISCGQLLGMALRKYLFPDYLRDFAALAAALLTFGIAESIQSESGLLAVTIMGIWLANMRGLEIEDILNFKESLSLLLVSGLFILLAARLDLTQLSALGMGGVIVLLVLQFVAGPLRAYTCSIGSSLNWRERTLIGWVFPRGIVAAAIASLFALRLEEAEVEGAEQLVPLVFAIIIGTVVIQSITAGPLARKLKVAEPEPRGILIVGGNDVARMLAVALSDAGFRVLLADDNWENIKKSRMLAIPSFYGNAVSAYADRHMDLIGLGYLLALSSRPALNRLACVRYEHEFGMNGVFALQSTAEIAQLEKKKISDKVSGSLLFGKDITYEFLSERLITGAEVHTTLLTSEFTLEHYRQEHPDAILLFAVDHKDNLRMSEVESDLSPESGWKLVSLVSKSESRVETLEVNS